MKENRNHGKWDKQTLILHMIQNNVFYRELFCRNLSRLFEREEGAGSMRARLCGQLANLEQMM